MRRLVVVGASLAGLRAAQAARAAGFDGDLVVIGDEPHLPYTRPPLSKELLAGVQTPDDCAFPSQAIDAHWRLGTRATGLDRAARRVRLADGEHVAYDRLIVATGCRARPWPGEAVEGMHTLRSVDDALRLKAAFATRPRVAIIGAGFIGCEVAATARKQDLDVTLVDIAPHPMLPLGPELGERCAVMHRRHGVDLRLETGVASIDGGTLTLADGARVDADVVVVALGAVPNTEWLGAPGGMACDATLTSLDDPDVLGAGDAISWPHPLADGEPVRVEHWTTAAEHGQLAGRNALLERGERAPHVLPPYFWSDQYDVKIQAVGFPARAERLEILESTREGDRFVAAGARDGRLVGVVAFNAAKRLGWYRRQLPDAPAFDDIRNAVAADEKALGAAVVATT
ncbi:MAG TPA: FAD-dependent oxidoreductase [Solirubrobacteraceae bacterium]|nr:FAD-dependent oxidoreductase [Solirubrobacteraceae bacterium]